METKQVIVVRKDLKMKPGKLAAQVSHASMGAFFDATDMNYHINNPDRFEVTDTVKQWVNGEFTKVILKVDSVSKHDQLLMIKKSVTIPICKKKNII